MKLIVEQKPINFEEEITVKMTIKELVMIYVACADIDSETAVAWLRKYRTINALEEEAKEEDLPYQVFMQISEILKQKNIYL